MKTKITDSRVISFRLGDELDRQVRAAAKARALTVTAYIRTTLAEIIKGMQETAK